MAHPLVVERPIMSYVLYLAGFRLIIIIINNNKYTHHSFDADCPTKDVSAIHPVFPHGWGDPYININIPVNCFIKYIYIILLESIYFMLGSFIKHKTNLSYTGWLPLPYSLISMDP
ncbi:hypothetical protein GCM10010129_80280 [Streptomyces fumigatiscleroticus]|nr:hypothetical protein GCM10010129_80280 [Streptomyces fumigatiscleroticus]